MALCMLSRGRSLNLGSASTALSLKLKAAQGEDELLEGSHGASHDAIAAWREAAQPVAEAAGFGPGWGYPAGLRSAEQGLEAASPRAGASATTARSSTAAALAALVAAGADEEVDGDSYASGAPNRAWHGQHLRQRRRPAAPLPAAAVAVATAAAAHAQLWDTPLHVFPAAIHEPVMLSSERLRSPAAGRANAGAAQQHQHSRGPAGDGFSDMVDLGDDYSWRELFDTLAHIHMGQEGMLLARCVCVLCCHALR